MFHLTNPLPKNCFVAVSGGIDSMFALHWLNRRPGRVVGIVHINHVTGPFSYQAEKLVRRIGETIKPLHGTIVYTLPSCKTPKGRSKEEYWREQRYYKFYILNQVYRLPIVLAHNLNDCVEEYVMKSIVKGKHGTIGYSNSEHGCVRPFRTVSRAEIVQYMTANKLEWIDDPSNSDEKYLRNRVRHSVIPMLETINPGLSSMVKRMIITEKI